MAWCAERGKGAPGVMDSPPRTAGGGQARRLVSNFREVASLLDCCLASRSRHKSNTIALHCSSSSIVVRHNGPLLAHVHGSALPNRQRPPV